MMKMKMRVRVLSICLSLFLLVSCLPLYEVEAVAEEGAGTTYYVDSDGGSDDNTGTAPDQAWASLEKVNGFEFQPGDRLLFQKGDVWTGQLSPKGSGTKGNPIIIGDYGDGEARPLIQGNNWCADEGDDLENKIFNAAVFFYNQQYWEITSLEITNRIPGENPDDHIKKYGVLIMGRDAGTLEHMYCRNLYVHDVVSHPIGQQAGIARGGIIYVIRGNQVPTNWNDIVIEDNIVGPRINHYGINLLSTWGSSRFEHETGIPDAEYPGQRYDSTNIIIRNNYCEDVGNAAICPSAYKNAVIEYNTCNGCNSGPNGNVPIWWENGEHTVAQFNEVYGSGASEFKEDSQAFDADVNAKLNYIQYNYTHDNPSGAYFECALGTPYTTHIRYNISQNDGYGTNSYGGGAVVTLGGWSSDPKNKLYVYNNDFYLGEGRDSFITNNWDGYPVNAENFRFTNNIIYSDAQSKGWDENLMGTAENNAYGGTDSKILREDDEKAVAITAEDLKNIGSGGTGIDSVDGYQLSTDSKCRKAGTVIPGNGGRDYWGNPVSMTGTPNVGCDNSGAEVSQAAGAINFEDRPTEAAELKGSYAECEFGEGWYTKEQNGNKVAYLSNETDTGMIGLPKGKALKSFTASCEDIAWVTVSAGGYNKSYCVTSAGTSFDTGFFSAADEVEFSVQGMSGSESVYFDDLILEDAEYERQNLALNKPTETSGYDQNPGSWGNDGDEGTMWIHAGEDLNEYWIVDLGKDYDLSDFELVFEQDEAEGAWGYQIDGKNSAREDFDKTLLCDAADNSDGSRVQSGTVEPGSLYRYLRVTLTKFPGYDYWPGFSEFRVFERDYSGLDKSALSQKIAEAKYIEKGTYAEADYAALQEAIAAAKAQFEKAENEAQVTEAVNALQKAIDKLTTPPSDDKNPEEKPGEKPGDTGTQAPKEPAAGTKLTDQKTKGSYKVTSKGKTVAYAGTTNKKATSVTIPSKVKVGGITYKVTSVTKNAFKNNKKMKKVAIAGSITEIGSGAFQGCTALTKVVIPAKVKKIGSKAFYGCKKLTGLTIKSKLLTAKSVGSKAFTKAGSSNYKKLKVKVPAKKLASYKNLLKKKGLSSKAKIVK